MNSLDRVPQIPQDYANHILYGGLLGAAVTLILQRGFSFGVDAWAWALLAVFVVATAKKIYDYRVWLESLSMCVNKSLVTCVLPTWFLIAVHTFRM
jgi:hypothetical protein